MTASVNHTMEGLNDISSGKVQFYTKHTSFVLSSEFDQHIIFVAILMLTEIEQIDLDLGKSSDSKEAPGN